MSEMNDTGSLRRLEPAAETVTGASFLLDLKIYLFGSALLPNLGPPEGGFFRLLVR